jgi:hypothetical protein
MGSYDFDNISFPIIIGLASGVSSALIIIISQFLSGQMGVLIFGQIFILSLLMLVDMILSLTLIFLYFP